WNWTKPVLITPPGIDDKDACLFPEKINGQYLFIHRINSQICVDFVSSLEKAPQDVNRGLWLMGPRYGMWDSKKIGLAGPPIKTKAGWVLFYHGVSEDNHYSLGAALLDLKNPMLVLSRTSEAILEPEKKYEKEGQVPNVVFPCGHVLRGDTIYNYYGGADSFVGVATIKLSRLLAMLT
ncbi:MAG: glycosidase, partial [Candidatus Omnitrophica bacterium]|nr:glycosidase [Candidatus Omnitrophota bacterium]